jgi:hypothetical protein
VRHSQELPGSLKSLQAMWRFALRMVILVIFAAFAGTSFARSMVALLSMSALLCAVTAVMRRELPFRGELNHWDEMASYIALCSLASTLAF